MRFAKVASHGVFIADLHDRSRGTFDEYNVADAGSTWAGELRTGPGAKDLTFAVGEYVLEVAPTAAPGHYAGTERGPDGESPFDVYELLVEGRLPSRSLHAGRAWLQCTPEGGEVVSLTGRIHAINYVKVFLATIDVDGHQVEVHFDAERRCLRGTRSGDVLAWYPMP
jgi:hypothetical protein